MKLGLIGYGKMGHTIEAIALERGHEVAVKLTSSSSLEDWELLKTVDVAIEFSRPEAAIKNFIYCFERSIPIVTGTTGWYDDMRKVKELCKDANATFFWASNFSIGVNLFWEINQRLSKLMARHPEYAVRMTEIHHTQKLDEPSGTAITTAEQILNESSDLKNWALLSDHPEADQLAIESIREGDVKGTHIVHYESEVDIIELKHAAKTRKGFATGAVLAAEFVQGKRGLFTMSDLLREA